MSIKSFIAAGAVASMSLASAANADVVDLAFILDESGSVGQTDYESSVTALRNAINQIPLADASVTYRVGVVSFGEVADVVATPVAFDTAANKNAVLAALLDESSTTDGGTRGYNTPSFITSATNYVAAFNETQSAFINAFGSLGDTSIINMATDGGWNAGGDPTTRAGQLRTDGWDMLSFEAVANTSTSDENFLAGIGFDSGGIGGCGITTDPTSLTDVVNNCFVIDVPTFDEFESALLTKVRQTVIDTGGDPGTNVIPLPAAGWMLLAGIGALFGLRRRETG